MTIIGSLRAYIRTGIGRIFPRNMPGNVDDDREAVEMVLFLPSCVLIIFAPRPLPLTHIMRPW